MFNCLMGGQRFAHVRRLQDDRAVSAGATRQMGSCRDSD